jgi:hypothetical protein
VPKQITLQGADGGPLSLNFGYVPAGTSSASTPIRVLNSGDTALTGVLAWIEQTSVADGELRATVSGVTITGTSEATATTLTPPALGAYLSGEVWYYTPAGSAGKPLDQGHLKFKPI